ncbi:hypothetical protein ACQEVC_45390 [Plantactinospora sp. CA-294935]|uniref:hypothetical protein n=1 Tax=Plantactinospora sp. CA-294935 TaxID=3240012 RepID=UPI003D903521
MTRDLRQELAANREVRTKLTAELDGAEQEERALVADAWRAHIPPGEIIVLTGRSPAHVRKLRPTDVPPARTGGGAAKTKSA